MLLVVGQSNILFFYHIDILQFSKMTIGVFIYLFFFFMEDFLIPDLSGLYDKCIVYIICIIPFSLSVLLICFHFFDSIFYIHIIFFYILLEDTFTTPFVISFFTFLLLLYIPFINLSLCVYAI